MDTLPAVAEAAYAVDPVAINQSWLAKVEQLESYLMERPDAIWEPPLLIHRFSPGIYIREIHMNANTVVVGAQHNTEHFNIVLAGRASVFMEGQIHRIQAHSTFKSNVAVRKVLLIHEDMVWQTIHANPTDETDVPTLEARLFTYTANFLKKKAEHDALLEASKQEAIA